jgi:hypothetical protein
LKRHLSRSKKWRITKELSRRRDVWITLRPSFFLSPFGMGEQVPDLTAG